MEKHFINYKQGEKNILFLIFMTITLFLSLQLVFTTQQLLNSNTIAYYY